MIRCHVVCDCLSPVSRSFQLRLVASESIVKDALLLVVLVSASLPRNPVSDTRLAYMIFGLLFFCPRCLGAHIPEGARRAAPKARAAFSGRGPKLVLGEESGKSRSSQSAGRSYGAEAVPETQAAEDGDHNQCSDRVSPKGYIGEPRGKTTGRLA